jgi:hypothetical protein
MKGSKEAVQILIQLGADGYLKDINGEDSFDKAKSYDIPFYHWFKSVTGRWTTKVIKKKKLFSFFFNFCFQK